VIWLFNIVSIGLLGAIVWWFWLSKPTIKKGTQGGPIKVKVENGVYTPSVIEVDKGTPLDLVFLRKDPSPCAEKVVFSDFAMSQDLTLNEETHVELTPMQPGSYEFTCQMGMYRGKLIVD
jgi:plastocyanin domain-containing protein